MATNNDDDNNSNSSSNNTPPTAKTLMDHSSFVRRYVYTNKRRHRTTRNQLDIADEQLPRLVYVHRSTMIVASPDRYQTSHHITSHHSKGTNQMVKSPDSHQSDNHIAR